MSRVKTLAKARAQAPKKPNPREHSRTQAFLTAKNLITVLCVLIAAATILLYSPVTGYSFLLRDDADYVAANSHIHGGLSWNTVKWAFTSTDAVNWHPLTWLSHALDYQLFALNPAGHHLDSVLIHALNAVLLFLLLAWGTKRVGPSLLVAALFAVHPLNVESVAWIAERKNVLSTLFWLLAIGGYAWYAQKPEWRRYLLVLMLFAAGLMAKPMVITLPFVLLLLDYWPLGRTAGSPPSVVHAPQLSTSRLLLEKIPLLFLSAASAWITLLAQRHAERTFEAVPLAIRIENAVVAYGLYLWKMLWPVRLAALYSHPGNTLPMWQVILSGLILVGVTALVVLFRNKRYLAVGWFCFLGTLVPVIGFVPVIGLQVGNASMADRYAYVPLIGIFVMIAFGLADLAQANVVRPVWCVIPALCALIVLGYVTSRQMSYWESEYTLWSHTLAVTDPGRSARAHDALGAALLDPDHAMTQHDIGTFDTEQKRMNEARQHYEEALKIDRQQVRQHPEGDLQNMAMELNNLGFLDRRQNRMDEARLHYEDAVKIQRQLARQNPVAYEQNSAAATLNNLGNLDRRQNRMDEARQCYEEALKIDRQIVEQNPDKYLPDLATTLNNLGAVDQLQNRLDDARQHNEEVLKIYRQLAQQDPAYLPDLAEILNNLGKLDGIQNRLDDARTHFEGALSIYRQLAQKFPDEYLPGLAGTLKNLGFLDRLQMRLEQSRTHYTEAVTIYRKLAQGNSGRYANDIAKVEASLQELNALSR